jgi:hypothetical protein
MCLKFVLQMSNNSPISPIICEIDDIGNIPEKGPVT